MKVFYKSFYKIPKAVGNKTQKVWRFYYLCKEKSLPKIDWDFSPSHLDSTEYTIG